MQTKQEFIDANSKSIDQAQSLIDVLLILSVIIAALGVVNTLALSVLERSRELGLLRALGLTRRQTRSMVRWEAVIIALLGALLGLVIGAGMGTAVVRALANQGLSKLSVPAAQLLALRGGRVRHRRARGGAAGSPRGATQRARRDRDGVTARPE